METTDVAGATVAQRVREWFVFDVLGALGIVVEVAVPSGEGDGYCRPAPRVSCSSLCHRGRLQARRGAAWGRGLVGEAVLAERDALRASRSSIRLTPVDNPS